MEYGIADLSIVPVRAEASEKSEMVTQLLFGEHFEIEGKSRTWTKIRVAHDQYEGWIDNKMFNPIDKEKFIALQEDKPFVTTEVFTIVHEENFDAPSFLVTGSSLPFFDSKKKTFYIGDRKFSYYGKLPDHLKKQDRDLLVEIALNYQNTPYLWGGRSTLGIDCSGFTQVLYKILGHKLPRDARQQVSIGTTLSFVNEAKPGDLAFFDNDDGDIIHVGMYLGGGKIIHSSGKVRVDTLDHQGIFNMNTKRYSHKLRVIQQILP